MRNASKVKVPVSLPDPETRRRLREGAGLSGMSLAAQIGVAPASLYAWETTKREPRGLLREAYAEALAELAELANVEEEEEEEEEGEWPTVS